MQHCYSLQVLVELSQDSEDTNNKRFETCYSNSIYSDALVSLVAILNLVQMFYDRKDCVFPPTWAVFDTKCSLKKRNLWSLSLSLSSDVNMVKSASSLCKTGSDIIKFDLMHRPEPIFVTVLPYLPSVHFKFEHIDCPA